MLKEKTITESNLIMKLENECHHCCYKEDNSQSCIQGHPTKVSSQISEIHWNTFKAIQSTFRSLEMHSKRRVKICICSLYLFGDPRGTWVFSKSQGPQYYFLESFRGNFMYYESENFSDFSLQHIFLNPKILGFIFSTKNSPA